MRFRSPGLLNPLAPALVLVAGIMLMSAVTLWRGYQDAPRRGEETARNLVHVLAEQQQRTLQAVDFALLGVRDSLADRPDLPPNDPRLHARLHERVKGLPYVRGLIVVGPDGFLAHDTSYLATPQVNAADRPYFEAHQDEPDQDLYLGHPLQSRADETWVISISRQIDWPDDSFGGVVVAVVCPSSWRASIVGGLSGRMASLPSCCATGPCWREARWPRRR